MSSREHLWQSIRDALSPANYNPKQLSDYRKELIVRTFVHGPRAELRFEAKVPRSSENELGFTITWVPETRAECAAFVRELADLIERNP